MHEHPMMKCGHAANSVTDDDKPACAICARLNEGAYEIDISAPSLVGRKARCSSYGAHAGRNHGPIYGGNCKRDGNCDCECDSNTELPFFEYCGPNSAYENKCKNCMYFADSHPSQGGTGCFVNSKKKMPDLCENKGGKFEPCVGGLPFDNFYCGCCGWD